MSLAVLIPTFRRPEGVARALGSVLAQSRLPDEIIVVDNDPAASARQTVSAIAADAPVPVVHVHEPRPGVANARNAGFAATGAELIAQLDDDEEAAPDWLAALLAARETLNAQIVFGPVTAAAHDDGAVRRAFMRRLYSRGGADTDVLLDDTWGCGNSLIDRGALDLPDPPFHPATNETGGEDDQLFTALRRQGCRFGWAAQAHVTEHVEGRRARWRYLLARSFAYGQGASQNCVHEGRTDWAGAGFWMAVGAGQLAVYGIALPVALLAGAERGAACLDRAVQGAGKLVWAESLGPRFYGASAPA